MAIEVGAQIVGIVQRTVTYMDPNAVPPATEVQYFRDVAFTMVGLPAGTPPVNFTIAVNDATQWDQLQVGQTCTIAIYPPA